MRKCKGVSQGARICVETAKKERRTTKEESKIEPIGAGHDLGGDGKLAVWLSFALHLRPIWSPPPSTASR